MLVTSQLIILTTQIFYSFLTCTCAPHLEKGSTTHGHNSLLLRRKTFVALNKFPHVKVARNTKMVGQACLKYIAVKKFRKPTFFSGRTCVINFLVY